jgi:hypothetical protein
MPLHFRLEASYKLRACNVAGCTDSAVVDVVGSLAEAVGYFKASNTGSGDMFGYSVALSGDGNTLAVAPSTRTATRRASAATRPTTPPGIGGRGLRVRARRRGWSQQAYVKASNTDSEDWFGVAWRCRDDGNTLAVGASRKTATRRASAATRPTTPPTGSGAVYVFVRDGGHVVAAGLRQGLQHRQRRLVRL